MTELHLPTAPTPTPTIVVSNRFGMLLPQYADRVDVAELEAAYEVLDDNAAHLHLTNDFSIEQNVDGALGQAQLATPSTPPPGWLKLYPKADGEYYKLDEFGMELPLARAGACFHEEFLPADGDTVVSLSQVAQRLTMVARGGVVQSEADGNYTLASTDVTFTEPFDGTERLIVEYAPTRQARTSEPITITGSRGADGPRLLEQLLAALSAMGLIVDQTTA